MAITLHKIKHPLYLFSSDQSNEIQGSDIKISYLLTGYRICCVVGDREYAFAPSALHLQHPVNRYVSSKKMLCEKRLSVMGIFP